MYEAKDPNLAKFFAHGGKLLVVARRKRPGPAPTGTLDYARAVMAKNPRAAQQFRVFLAPGVGHCGGGPGADVLPRGRHDRRLGTWQPRAGNVVATKRDKSLTRLDCAWPKVAHYRGRGEPNDPSSWSCVAEGGPASHPGERG